MLFYSKNSDGISAYSIFIYLIKKYHTNRNIADFVDYIQDQVCFLSLIDNLLFICLFFFFN